MIIFTGGVMKLGISTLAAIALAICAIGPGTGCESSAQAEHHTVVPGNYPAGSGVSNGSYNEYPRAHNGPPVAGDQVPATQRGER